MKNSRNCRGVPDGTTWLTVFFRCPSASTSIWMKLFKFLRQKCSSTLRWKWNKKILERPVRRHFNHWLLLTQLPPSFRESQLNQPPPPQWRPGLAASPGRRSREGRHQRMTLDTVRCTGTGLPVSSNSGWHRCKFERKNSAKSSAQPKRWVWRNSAISTVRLLHVMFVQAKQRLRKSNCESGLAVKEALRFYRTVTLAQGNPTWGTLPIWRDTFKGSNRRRKYLLILFISKYIQL